MPHGVRRSLIAACLCTGFAAHAASGSTWTDPPARKPETAKPAPQAAAPATPAAVSQPEQREARVKRHKAEAPRKVAVRHRRVRVVHEAPPSRVAARRAPHVVAMAPPPPAPRRYVYRTYSEAGFPPSYEDQRLDRLSTAVGSGYLVMRRRTVEYPDGRVIRFYRPVEDDGME